MSYFVDVCQTAVPIIQENVEALLLSPDPDLSKVYYLSQLATYCKVFPLAPYFIVGLPALLAGLASGRGVLGNLLRGVTVLACGTLALLPHWLITPYAKYKDQQNLNRLLGLWSLYELCLSERDLVAEATLNLQTSRRDIPIAFVLSNRGTQPHQILKCHFTTDLTALFSPPDFTLDQPVAPGGSVKKSVSIRLFEGSQESDAFACELTLKLRDGSKATGRIPMKLHYR